MGDVEGRGWSGQAGAGGGEQCCFVFRRESRVASREQRMTDGNDKR